MNSQELLLRVAAPRPLSAEEGPRPALFGGRNAPQPPGSPVLPAPVHGVVSFCGPSSCLLLATTVPVAELSALQKVTAELLRGLCAISCLKGHVKGVSGSCCAGEMKLSCTLAVPDMPEC